MTPRAPDGTPAADGWIGVVAVGMSNTNQEWSRFERESDRLARHAGRVVLVDAAKGGADAFSMDEASDAYWTLFDARIAAAGLTLEQIQGVWLKQSVAGEQTVGEFPERTAPLRAALGDIVALLAARCPHLQLVFLSSRLYAGYSAAGREPFAYETAFAVKGLIQDQLDDVGGLGSGPWVGWGPYPWADGPTARADGLVWLPQDLEGDGIHPAPTAEWKVASRLDAHFDSHPLAAGWYAPPDDSALARLDAVADAEVDPAQPETNFGAAPTLRLDGGRRVYVRFDLSAVASPLLRAKLSLLVDAQAAVPPSRVYALGAVAWEELEITWSTAPPLPPAPVAETPSWSRGSAPGIDVTAAVAAALAAGAGAVTFALDTPAPAGPAAPLSARESGEPPRLVLTLDAPGAPPPIFVDGFETGDFWLWR